MIFSLVYELLTVLRNMFSKSSRISQAFSSENIEYMPFRYRMYDDEVMEQLKIFNFTKTCSIIKKSKFKNQEDILYLLNF